MERYKVIVSDRAKTMLGAHIKFVAQVDPAAARDTKTKLLAAIRSLSETPERFPFLDEEFVPRGKYRKMFAERRYLLLYQTKIERFTQTVLWIAGRTMPGCFDETGLLRREPPCPMRPMFQTISN